MFRIFLMLLIFFGSTSAVIYRMNDADYALMPPIFILDDYEECLQDPEGLYCTADFAVVSDEPSPLLTMMQIPWHRPSKSTCCLARYCAISTYSTDRDKLMAPAAGGREPRLKALRGIHGIRSLNMIFVIAGHSIAVIVMLPENASSTENLFIADPFHILVNGTLIMQTFLLISSFLLVYYWLIYSEEHAPSWKMIPKLIMMRWLRLTPSYAVILALTGSWFGRLTSGPYWQKSVGDELSDCRRYWWMHLLYINNYFDKSKCMGHSWYLATDSQLYYMASIIIVMCRTARSRKVVLSLLFVLGVVVPTLQTYYQNLDGVLVVTPEFALAIFQNSPTFDHIYKRGHTNLTGYVIGMAMGYWVYDWQKAGGDPKGFRKYRFLCWNLLPLGGLCCYSGTIFYTYSAAPSFAVNLMFAAFIKPIFAIIVASFIVAFTIQIEDIYRPVVEWSGWTVPSRLTFSAYLLHLAVLRNFIAMQTTTYRVTATVIVARGLMLVISAFISGFFFYILVEGPFGILMRECFIKPELIEENKEVNKDSKKKEDAKKQNDDANKEDRSSKKEEVAKIVNTTDVKEVVDKISNKSIEKNR